MTGEDDEYPRRVAGEVTCGTSLDLGRLRLDCAFFEWRTEGRAGTGPLRPPAARVSRIEGLVSDSVAC